MQALRKVGALVAVFLALFAGPAFAQSVPAALDYAGITGAVDVSSTIAAIMTVGGIVALVAVATMGVRKVLRMIR